MAREEKGSGGRKGRVSGPKGKSDSSKGKSGWVKPDGTPLRKRKGDYFPDQEINKRKPAQRSKSSFPKSSDDQGTEKGDFNQRQDRENSGSTHKTRPERSDRPVRSGRDDSRSTYKPGNDKTDRPIRSGRDDSRATYKPRPERDDRPERSERDDSRATYKPRPESDRTERPGRDDSRSSYKPRPERSDRHESSGRDDSRNTNKPETDRTDRPLRSDRSAKPERSGRPGRAGRDAARSEYRGRPDIAPRGDRPERPARDAARDDEKSGADRPSREDRSDKPVRKGSYAEYKSRSGKEDRNSNEDKEPGSSSGPKRDDNRTAYSKKPFEKKREKYADRDHSKEMRGRFDTKTGDKAPKRRESYKKKIADGNNDSEEIQGAVRLNKFIANAGICSRREADDLITAGVIAVNGVVITELGTKVLPGDEVKFNDQTLRTERLVYVLLNKPKDYITTTEDPEERKTVMNLVHDACKERIFPVGRLDRNTTGLLLITNDGELTKRLTHPSGNIKKIYQVELDSNLTQDDMIRAAEGVELEDGPASVDEIHYESPTEKNIIGVELHSGRNRVVRRIFESMDYKVRKLDRVYFAGLTKKDLPRGRWRYLTEMEVNMLKMLTGKKK